MIALKKKDRVFIKWDKLDVRLKRQVLVIFSNGIRYETQSVFKENEGIIDVFVFETNDTKYLISIPETFKKREKIDLRNLITSKINYKESSLSYLDFLKSNR